jgi:hypothetical protein
LIKDQKSAAKVAAQLYVVQVSPDAIGRDADRKRLHDTTMLNKELMFVSKKIANAYGICYW